MTGSVKEKSGGATIRRSFYMKKKGLAMFALAAVMSLGAAGKTAVLGGWGAGGRKRGYLKKNRRKGNQTLGRGHGRNPGVPGGSGGHGTNTKG